MLSNCIVPSNDEISKRCLAIGESNNINKTVLPQIKFSRNMIKSPGILSSVYVDFGSTIVLCSVFSPRASAKGGLMNLGSLECEVNFAIHITDEELSLIYPNIERILVEKRFSEAMEDTLRSSIRLECYPKTLISMNALVIQTSRHDISTIINAGSLALAYASIQLFDLTSSCSIFFTDHLNNSIEKDGSSDQSKIMKLVENPSINDANIVQFTASYMLSLDYLSQSYTEGRFSKEQFLIMQSTSKERCKVIKDIMQLELSQYYQT